MEVDLRYRTLAVLVIHVGLGLSLIGCGQKESGHGGLLASKRVVEYGQEVPMGGGVYKVGNPYQIAGRWYYPKEDPDYQERGMASWYGHQFHGRYTANGEIFDMDSLSAAHPTMPLPSYAQVTNLETGHSVVVRVNDRGPYAHDRVIDLSKRAAQELGFQHKGVARVEVSYLSEAPLSGEYGWVMVVPDLQSPPLGAPEQIEEIRFANLEEVPIPVLASASDNFRDEGEYVQIASMLDVDNARHLVSRLRIGGYPAEVVPADVSGLTYYRVRVGPISSEKMGFAAMRLAQDIQSGEYNSLASRD